MSIARNTAYMTVASIGQKVISFLYFTLVARTIGVEGTGKYFLALSFTTIFVVFVDMGFTQVLVRETARAKHQLQEYLSSVLFIKLFFAVVAYSALLVTVWLMGIPADTRVLIVISGLTMLFDSFHATLYGVMRSLGTLRYEALSITLTQLLTLVLGSIFLFFRFPLFFLMVALGIPSFLNVCFIGSILWKKYHVRVVPRYYKETLRLFWWMALPFALSAIFARVYSYADSVILSQLLGETAVGWYSIPYKITYAFQFVPLALVAALYPKFSELYGRGDHAGLGNALQKGMKYLFTVAAPIVVGISLLADDIIVTLYSQAYAPSILPLKILIISLLFSYLSFPLGAFLNACHRQKTQTTIVGIVMVCNILLNILLIPRFGVAGAALAAAIGNFLLTFGGAWFVSSITTIHIELVVATFLKISLAAFVMGIIVWLINEQAHFVYAIIAGAVSYPMLLLATRAVTLRDLADMRSTIRHV